MHSRIIIFNSLRSQSIWQHTFTDPILSIGKTRKTQWERERKRS